jgi:hypothetical protein
MKYLFIFLIISMISCGAEQYTENDEQDTENGYNTKKTVQTRQPVSSTTSDDTDISTTVETTVTTTVNDEDYVDCDNLTYQLRIGNLTYEEALDSVLTATDFLLGEK